MDGNRRWAQQNGLSRVGRDGIEAAYRTVEFCLAQKTSYLSLFAFSLENFKRSPHEVTHLFDLMVHEMHSQKNKLIEKGIKVRFIGDQSQFPAHVWQTCKDLEEVTQHGTALHVNMLICYGARQELINATRRIAHDIQNGHLTADTIDDTVFESYLWTADIPNPDLIIRTSGARRLSNFLLYQAAYAELYFLDCFWPAITEQDLTTAYTYFEHCKRNFGT
jgi:undecaprenyl diphosphate synthase